MQIIYGPAMFGVECFIASHGGFRGELKSCPEDFVVKEISPDGRLESVVDGNIVDLGAILGIEKSGISSAVTKTVGTDGDAGVSFELNTEDAETKSPVETGCHEKPCQNLDSVVPENHKYKLASVLDHETFEKLEVFAALMLDELKGEQPVQHKANNQKDRDELNLGLLPSKDTRTIIHKSIRQAFPHLRTTNHKISGQTGLEVHVAVEPVISEFQALQVHLTRVLDFIRFVESRVPERTFSLENLGSKEQRTSLHRLVSKHYGSFLETKTFEGSSPQEQSRIVVRFRQKFKDNKRRRKEANSVAEQETFTGFTLEKTNTETLTAIQQLARLVGVHPSHFSYAGSKDKRAVTTQHMAVKGVTTKRLQAVVDQKLPHWLTIGKIYPRHQPILVGQLWGNHFDITLRNISPKEEISSSQQTEGPESQFSMLVAEVDKGLGTAEEEGFINYFGEQRFGAASLDPKKAVTSISAADIGCALLQQKYTDAVNLILSPDNGQAADPSDPSNVAKQHFQDNRSPKQALKLMPTDRTRECLILKALNRHGTEREGCIKALLNIPHSMRQMYVHALCSLIWNRVASWRMRYYGNKIAEGDLVLLEESEAHAVTRDDISKGIYSVNDVVLPLPGNRIQYPSHAAGGEYKRLLDDLGLEGCSFRLGALKLNIPGGYRRVITHPRNLKWEWGRGGGVTDKNTGVSSRGTSVTSKSSGRVGWDNTSSDRQHRECTDLDENVRVPSVAAFSDPPGGNDGSAPGSPVTDHHLNPSVVEHTAGCLNVADITPDSTNVEESKTQRSDVGVAGSAQYLSVHERRSRQMEGTLTMHFDLPASCYATIFLREVMKPQFSN